MNIALSEAEDVRKCERSAYQIGHTYTTYAWAHVHAASRSSNRFDRSDRCTLVRRMLSDTARFHGKS
jgi:hypothetical protein